MSDLFCRHNRFTADCPICSKGTLLESDSGRSRPRPSSPAPRRSGGKRASAQDAQFRGPYATAGPYERDGDQVEVRLEKVPGGIRLAEWSAGALRRQAPVLPAADLIALVAQARERELLAERELERLEAAAGEQPGGEPGEWGVSPGRTADLREELRVESVGDGAVRVARWILRPGAGWELQEAPPMLPASRFAEAITAARRAGVA